MDKKPPKGHRQKGAGTTIVDKGPVENQGVVIKTHQRLPSQILYEWTYKEKRPKPRFYRVHSNSGGHRQKCILPDAKDDKKSLEYAPLTDAENEFMAKEQAALLALSKHCGNIPHEKRLPEGFVNLWLDTIKGEGLKSDNWFNSKAEKAQTIHHHKEEKAQKRNVYEAKKLTRELPRFYLSERMRKQFAEALKTDDLTGKISDNVDEEMLAMFVQEGFDPADVIQCWSALEEQEIELTKFNILNKLLTTVNEEDLPEIYHAKGEYKVVKPVPRKPEVPSPKQVFLEWLKLVLLDKCEGTEVDVDSMLMTAEVFLEEKENLDDFVSVLEGEGVVLEELAAAWMNAFEPPPTPEAVEVAPEEQPSGSGGPTEEANEPDEPEEIPLVKPRTYVARPWFSPTSCGRPASFPNPMAEQRNKLPALQVHDQFQDLVQNQVLTVVKGDTGCGKSTQLPQFLPEGSLVIVTQPRRLAAVSLANRVAAERGEERAGEKSVGYSVRGETRISRTCSLVFCTIGVLLRKILSPQKDEDIKNTTHLVIDEAHERSLDMDLLLTIIRKKRFNKKLKMVIMSATLDVDVNENLSSNAKILSIPGRTFPVNLLYADGDLNIAAGEEARLGQINYEAVIEIILKLRSGDIQAPKGATLVFLPGVGEIEGCKRRLVQRGIAPDDVIPLYGGLPPQEQKKAFREFPTKIVLTTNVAETSITIPDVTVVIDSCQERRLTSVSEDRVPKLEYAFCTTSSMKQRMGRAGRVAPGVCIRLISQSLAEAQPHSPVPEMSILPLDTTMIQILAAGFSKDLLLGAPTPPTQAELDKAVEDLAILGALKQETCHPSSPYEVTPLGHHLARLPCDCRLGKLLVYGALLGCAQEAAALAGMLSVRNPLMRPRDNQAEERRRFGLELRPGGQFSDHCFWAALNLAPFSKTRSLGLSSDGMAESKKLREDFIRILKTIGFDCPKSPEGRWHLLRAACAAALYPQIATVRKPDVRYTKGLYGAMEEKMIPKEVKYFAKRGRVFSQPDSVLFHTIPLGSHVVYSSLRVITDRNTGWDKWLMDGASDASPHALLFFGGKLEQSGNELQVGHVRFQGGSRLSAALIEAVRREVDVILQRKIADPDLCVEKEPIIITVRKCITSSGMGTS